MVMWPAFIYIFGRIAIPMANTDTIVKIPYLVAEMSFVDQWDPLRFTETDQHFVNTRGQKLGDINSL